MGCTMDCGMIPNMLSAKNSETSGYSARRTGSEPYSTGTDTSF